MSLNKNEKQNRNFVKPILEVICPNYCFNGMVKIFQDEKALYDLVKCPYCKGKGTVSENESKRIEAIL